MEKDEAKLSLLQDSLSVEIPVKSPLEDGVLVFKSKNNFHLLAVDDTYGTRWRIPTQIKNHLFGLTHIKFQ